jgi:hypothetical protein
MHLSFTLGNFSRDILRYLRIILLAIISGGVPAKKARGQGAKQRAFG